MTSRARDLYFFVLPGRLCFVVFVVCHNRRARAGRKLSSRPRVHHASSSKHGGTRITRRARTLPARAQMMCWTHWTRPWRQPPAKTQPSDHCNASAQLSRLKCSHTSARRRAPNAHRPCSTEAAWLRCCQRHAMEAKSSVYMLHRDVVPLGAGVAHHCASKTTARAHETAQLAEESRVQCHASMCMTSTHA